MLASRKNETSLPAPGRLPEKAGSCPITVDALPSDTILYLKKLMQLVHYKPGSRWPVDAPVPMPGAIIPFRRVVAFYGNFYSAGMGVLGALSPDAMLAQLNSEVKKWEKADPLTPVQPALHYIAVTAQRTKGKDGKYRLRMPATEIDKCIRLAERAHAVVFLDFQVGHCSLMEELQAYSKYISLPNVHVGMDPEYSMKGGQVPCDVIGTYDAADVNEASTFLISLVKKFNLPPKMLVVHRFTQAMVTNYRDIRLDPHVQIIMNMDGFGPPALKRDSYQAFISNQPVQFTGFKLFYKQDKPMMRPEDVLKLYPSPIYIQYQ
jgi:hypothetical protein